MLRSDYDNIEAQPIEIGTKKGSMAVPHRVFRWYLIRSMMVYAVVGGRPHTVVAGRARYQPREDKPMLHHVLDAVLSESASATRELLGPCAHPQYEHGFRLHDGGDRRSDRSSPSALCTGL